MPGRGTGFHTGLSSLPPAHGLSAETPVNGTPGRRLWEGQLILGPSRTESH